MSGLSLMLPRNQLKFSILLPLLLRENSTWVIWVIKITQITQITQEYKFLN